MKRKTLQDVANTLPDMLVGWRMAEDLDRLSDLPDGTLRIDLLRETAEHSGAGPITLHVVAELTAWLRDRLTALEIPLTELTHANVDAEIRTNRIATDRKRTFRLTLPARAASSPCSEHTRQRFRKDMYGIAGQRLTNGWSGPADD